MLSKIESLIKNGEGLRIEFKECNAALSKNVFETVCAFLNRFGGELLIGVSDHGKIIGIKPEALLQIKNDFNTAINNPQKINPPFYLSIEEVVIEDKTILYVYVPESSQVHRCNGKIFDRNDEGDFNITDNNSLVTLLYLRKQITYSENKVYPYTELTDLREDVIAFSRKRAAIQYENHPWVTMNDLELLKSAQLYAKDHQTGKDGITLAGILLFGKDNTILSVSPHFKTDAILRRDNIDRYDDRDIVCTNLIESYDRLIHFGEKHLNDPFYLIGDQRVSLRSYILREVVSNLLIHREFTNAFPAKLVIEREKFYTENSNKPHNIGIIEPSSFLPYPKNPVIARVFRQIGRADELGSGMRKLTKFSKAYCGYNSQLVDGDIFRFILPFTEQVVMDVTPQVPRNYPASTPQVSPQVDRTTELLEFCRTPKSRREIQEFIGLKDREYFRLEILKPLLAQGLLHPTIPGKLRSSMQKYYSNKKD